MLYARSSAGSKLHAPRRSCRVVVDFVADRRRNRRWRARRAPRPRSNRHERVENLSWVSAGRARFDATFSPITPQEALCKTATLGKGRRRRSSAPLEEDSPRVRNRRRPETALSARHMNASSTRPFAKAWGRSEGLTREPWLAAATRRSRSRNAGEMLRRAACGSEHSPREPFEQPPAPRGAWLLMSLAGAHET